MHIVVLGAAAGGGFPQWNCNAPTSRKARQGAPETKPRTQASIAVSADGERWLLLNASPDLRQQILRTPQLWPQHGLRHSPIEAVVLTSAEIDHVAGLLSLRESQPLNLWGSARVLAVLDENPIFSALSPAFVPRRPYALDEAFMVSGPSGPLGLDIRAFAVPGKVPLFLEGRNAGNLAGSPEETTGLAISAQGRRFHYIPGCAALTADLRRELDGSDLLFFDGTLWRDDEMIRLGVGSKTGQRMGHMSLDGPDGTLAAFADLDIGRKIFIHVNTTNPILDEGSPEHAAMTAQGWEVAEDGQEIRL